MAQENETTGVGQQVQLLREKSHAEQEQDLCQNDHLPPVQGFQALEVFPEQFRRQNAGSESDQRDQVMKRFEKISGKQVLAQQHDVARLGIGVNLAAEKVGICVL